MKAYSLIEYPDDKDIFIQQYSFKVTPKKVQYLIETIMNFYKHDLEIGKFVLYIDSLYLFEQYTELSIDTIDARKKLLVAACEILKERGYSCEILIQEEVIMYLLVAPDEDALNNFFRQKPYRWDTWEFVYRKFFKARLKAIGQRIIFYIGTAIYLAAGSFLLATSLIRLLSKMN